MRFPALALLTLGLAAPAAAQTPIVRVSFGTRSRRAQSRDRSSRRPSRIRPRNRRRKDPVFSWKDHPTLTIGIVEVGFRARVAVRLGKRPTTASSSRTTSTAASICRAGASASTVRSAAYADFQVERELQDDADPWRDVYVNYSQFDEVQFQLRQVQAAVQPRREHQRDQSRLRVSIARREHARAWTRHRLDGARPRRQAASSATSSAVFEHDGDNARPRNLERVFGGRTDAGRLGVQPFRSVEDRGGGSHVGVAWTSSDVPSRASRRCAARRCSGRGSTGRTTASRASASGSASRCAGGRARSA